MATESSLNAELARARSSVNNRSVLVDLIITDDLPPCELNREDLKQIVHHLMRSAACSTQRGRISVILGLQTSRLWLMVTDTGRGIDERSLLRIFPSRESHDAPVPRSLARRWPDLARAKELAIRAGGSMSISSRVGSGTIAEVRLPIHTTCPNLQAAARCSPEARSPSHENHVMENSCSLL